MRTRAWSIALVIAAAALVSWLALQREHDRTPDDALARPAGDAPNTRGEPSAAIVSADTEAAAIDEALATDPSARNSVAPAAAGELLVRVTSEAEGKPLDGVRVYLDHRSIPEAEIARFFRYQPDFTDAAGEVRLAVPAGSPLQIHVRAGGAFAPRELQVDALAPDEARVLAVEIYGGGDLQFHGRVVDGTTGLPLAGARVEALPLAPHVQETDAGGRFSVRGDDWGNVVIAREGYAQARFRTSAGHESPDRARRVEMQRTAGLVVHLAATRMSLQRLTLCVTASRAVLDRLESEPDALDRALTTRAEEPQARSDRSLDDLMFAHVQRFSPAERQEWRSPPDASGKCGASGLPSGVPLAVELLDGVRLVRFLAEPLVLDPAETRELVWDLDRTARIRGRVLDQDDRPVANCEVGLRPTLRLATRWNREGFEQYDFTWQSTDAAANTDADGSFSIEDVQPGRWWLAIGVVDGVRVAPHDVRDGDPGEFIGRVTEESLRRARDSEWHAKQVAARPRPIDVSEGGVDAAVELRVCRGLNVSGRVVSGDGTGRFSTLRARSSDGAGDEGPIEGVHSDDDGTFVVGPLLPGRYVVTAEDGGQEASVEVEAGSRNIVLVLDDAKE